MMPIQNMSCNVNTYAARPSEMKEDGHPSARSRLSRSQDARNNAANEMGARLAPAQSHFDRVRTIFYISCPIVKREFMFAGRRF
jgi:hypothetical protein